MSLSFMVMVERGYILPITVPFRKRVMYLLLLQKKGSEEEYSH